MTRISKLSSAEDFALEVRREKIRNSRWQRHRNMAVTFAFVFLILELATRFRPSSAGY
jgi:hypothetical protein